MARRAYTAGTVEVSYDPGVCVHAAECVHGLPQVFDPDARPWIRPGNATPEAIEAVVAKCPTGALRFRRLGPAQPAPAQAPVTAARVVARTTSDGPVIVTGGIVVEDSKGRVLREAAQVALCRCGHSASKPFCDGSHAKAGFRAE